MKKIFSVLAVCAMLCSCTTDWGALETVYYPINGTYTKLDISNAFQVTVSGSETATDSVALDAINPVASVTVGEKAHQYVQVEVIDGTLYIGMKKWNYSAPEKGVVVLPANTTLSLNELRASGASSFQGSLLGDEVSMRLSGASRFDGTMRADNVDLEISGASYAAINGFCMEELKIDISGASMLDGDRFPCTKISGGISGASRANVICCESLKVNVSGASELTYGTPSDECSPVVDCECTGSSTVVKK